MHLPHRGCNAVHLSLVGGMPVETTRFLQMQKQSLIPSSLLRRLEAVTWPEGLGVQLLQGSQPLSAAAHDAIEALQVRFSATAAVRRTSDVRSKLVCSSAPT